MVLRPTYLQLFSINGLQLKSGPYSLPTWGLHSELHTGHAARLDLKNRSKLITIPLCSEVAEGQADFRDGHECGPGSFFVPVVPS